MTKRKAAPKTPTVHQRIMCAAKNGTGIHLSAADVEELVRAAQDVSSLVEFYAGREMNAPANNQEAVRDTREKLRNFRKALEAFK